ncbi:MAG: thioredoxin family protein [Candidatus Woesearchaeota archaeon]
MIIKVFIQPSCPKCPAAKKVISQVEHKTMVEYHDIQTADGLAEALDYGVMATPSVVVLDEEKNVVKEWNGVSPTLEEMNAILK